MPERDVEAEIDVELAAAAIKGLQGCLFSSWRGRGWACPARAG
jgi:hypothetical protein